MWSPTATATWTRVKAYSEAIRLFPEYVEAYNDRGSVYYDKNDRDQAIADFSEAIRINPRFAWPYHNRHVYLAKGDVAKALEGFNEAIRLDPRYTMAYIPAAARSIIATAT